LLLVLSKALCRISFGNDIYCIETRKLNYFTFLFATKNKTTTYNEKNDCMPSVMFPGMLPQLSSHMVATSSKEQVVPLVIKRQGMVLLQRNHLAPHTSKVVTRRQGIVNLLILTNNRQVQDSMVVALSKLVTNKVATKVMVTVATRQQVQLHQLVMVKAMVVSLVVGMGVVKVVISLVVTINSMVVDLTKEIVVMVVVTEVVMEVVTVAAVVVATVVVVVMIAMVTVVVVDIVVVATVVMAGMYFLIFLGDHVQCCSVFKFYFVNTFIGEENL
jgi:hypothetical protein